MALVKKNSSGKAIKTPAGLAATDCGCCNPWEILCQYGRYRLEAGGVTKLWAPDVPSPSPTGVGGAAMAYHSVRRLTGSADGATQIWERNFAGAEYKTYHVDYTDGSTNNTEYHSFNAGGAAIVATGPSESASFPIVRGFLFVLTSGGTARSTTSSSTIFAVNSSDEIFVPVLVSGQLRQLDKLVWGGSSFSATTLHTYASGTTIRCLYAAGTDCYIGLTDGSGNHFDKVTSGGTQSRISSTYSPATTTAVTKIDGVIYSVSAGVIQTVDEGTGVATAVLSASLTGAPVDYAVDMYCKLVQHA